MALTWSGRRQVLYGGVGAVIVLIFLVFVYETFFTAPPTCFDGRQNGTETGIDCGGTCSLICADAAHPPIVRWTRSFQTSPNTYSAVAYIQNNNSGAGARNVAYSFQLFDDQNILVKERDGVVNLPPAATIPVTESNIDVGNRVVSRTLFSFSNDPPAVWDKVAPGAYPPLTISQPVHNGDFSKLSATVINDNVVDIKNVAVVVIVYDSNDVAVATSKSIIPRIAGRSRQSVVFTWPEGVPGAVRFEIIALPPF